MTDDLKQFYDEISLEEIEDEFKEIFEDTPATKLMGYQRAKLMFLAHDLIEVENIFKDCDACYCSKYCDNNPHLECRETRLHFLATKVIEHDEEE